MSITNWLGTCAVLIIVFVAADALYTSYRYHMWDKQRSLKRCPHCGKDI